MSNSVTLTTTIERKHPKMPRFVVIPSKAISSWALQGTTVVEGTLNGQDLGRRTIKRWDDQRWFMDLAESICKRAGVDTGDRVELVFQPASDRLPKELERLIKSNADAKAVWESLTPSRQRMVREHVLAAKQPATRERRAAKALCV